MKCFEFCVMLNKFGVCESYMRRPEHIKDCPHRKMSLENSVTDGKDNNKKSKTRCIYDRNR